MRSRLSALNPLPANQPLAVALATLQTSLLVLTGILVGYLTGGLGETLDGLSTLFGLTLFAYLWALNWFGVAGALRRFDSPSAPRWSEVTRAGVLWGGAAGVASIALPFAALLISSLVAGIVNTDVEWVFVALYVPVFAMIGGVIAAAVGALVGSVFAMIDLVLLSCATLAAAPPSQGTNESL